MQSEDTVHVVECKQTFNADWQQGKGLGACMLEMYDQSLWTDVTFHSKDQPEAATIKAHKIVLAARSPVFRAMFFGPCADRRDDVELEHVTRETFDLFLRYIYSESLDLSAETAFDILRIAHFYQVSSLVQYCADFLMNVITTENAM
ncbi:BTB/POZ domain-containing protein 6-like [Ruditapes philippinarum]|uniref:BTB/POZ domain-containing protein 6-like n=1 Tax=Ruditapes philippinarum TaxID=129788 RepID=UPI00295A9DA1|nr:BTB/POZ domain-containing protein 6-like [Ruditapes philippinarum]